MKKENNEPPKKFGGCLAAKTDMKKAFLIQQAMQFQVELKPCKCKCGAEADVKGYSIPFLLHDIWFVRCKTYSNLNKKCKEPPTKSHRSRNEAITAWNRRRS